MRTLTKAEIALVAGGDGTDEGGEIVVYGSSPSGGGYGSNGTYESAGPSPTSGPQDHGPAGPGHTHVTPHGYKYNLNASLDQEQTGVLDDIVEYGLTHGKSVAEINAVAALAFKESSFRQSAGSGTTHVGLGQYTTTEWAARGETGSIGNAQDQVKALYHDYDEFANRYSQATASNASGINDAHITMLEYYEIKHHAGSNSTDWDGKDPYSGNPNTHDDDVKFRDEINNASSYLHWQLM